LVRQCRNHLLIRKDFGEFDHARQVRPLEAAAKLTRQLVRQRRNDLFPAPDAPGFKHLPPDPVAQPPIEEGQAGVHRHCRPPPRIDDQPAQVFDQSS
jgi:hypothetical protein